MIPPAIGRFAPSPTGPLHYGSLLAAVASHLNIRSKNGTWLVRIDDLDPPREVAGASTEILHALEKYGLYWDKEVVYQSRRSELYNEALAQLTKDDLLYRCSCSRKEIMKRGESFYQGHCRKGHIPERKHFSLRIKTPDRAVTWMDLIQGQQIFNLFDSNGDFIVQRSDGLYAYHLAVVVDDANQQITQIIRGADLLTSTPAQCYLQQLLGIQPPQYGHIPVAVNAEGAKLSKQTGAKAVSIVDPARTLFRSLQDLGQDPPGDLEASSIDDILHWGMQNWVLGSVPAELTL
ncbi:MAG: tRNA glutamyl-Q(34) synthetase GluQRS [Gammaproteobacteria bacterium]|nr:MAG: tRNA glutamyl-Q(34) synthetase GluQRS [Gammaproteobacteria bacterium]